MEFLEFVCPLSNLDIFVVIFDSDLVYRGCPIDDQSDIIQNFVLYFN